MERYLLDTNICISMLKNQYGVREAVLSHNPSNCFVSEITIAELYYGASKSNNKAARLQDVAFITNHFRVVPIYQSLPLYGDVKALLEKEGNRIDEFDLLIGTTAVCNDMVMVTDNVKHLGRIPHLKVENWTNRK